VVTRSGVALPPTAESFICKCPGGVQVSISHVCLDCPFTLSAREAWGEYMDKKGTQEGKWAETVLTDGEFTGLRLQSTILERDAIGCLIRSCCSTWEQEVWNNSDSPLERPLSVKDIRGKGVSWGAWELGNRLGGGKTVPWDTFGYAPLGEPLLTDDPGGGFGTL
jgi:hypothetical protein